MRTTRKQDRREDMKDKREEWYEPALRVSVTFVDATTAARELARAHLCGPVSAKYLARALAEAALLGAETSLPEETVSVQMKCTGPLGGVNVECTAAGTLRGYAEKKLLDGFDGEGGADDSAAVGDRRYQVTRSVPGRVLSQGIASSVEDYLRSSLQRRARIFTYAEVNDDVEVLQARGLMVEAMPDSGFQVDRIDPGALSASRAKMLSCLGLGGAELKNSAALRFACRCSPERAAAMLGAMNPEELASMPDRVDVTCHMCGRTFTVRTRGGEV
jgi:molecular chaperone Hsp33